MRQAILPLFCDIDDFCQRFSLSNRRKVRGVFSADHLKDFFRC